MSNHTIPTLHNFINGQYQPALSGASFEKIAPASGRPCAVVSASNADDINAAVLAAKQALQAGAWATMPAQERGRCLSRLADLLEANAADFITTLAEEQGRPRLDMTMMDLPMSVDTLRYFAGWADKLEGRTVPTAGFMGRAMHNYTRLDPVGVAALIVPWNAPLMIAIWKLAPALTAGCTVVIKTSEEAPVAVGQLGRLVAEAGFPPGVVNIVHGMGTEAGSALTAHPDVSKISFTGSTGVGRIIARDAASSFKRVTLELGGKAAQILLEDADLEEAIPGLVMGAFVNQGQTCAAGSRILVHRSLLSQVEQALAAAADAMRLGGADVEGAQMGALISARHLQRVQACIDTAVSQGARRLSGDKAEQPTKGYFLRPTVFTDVTPDMQIAKEEVFGPVCAIIPFDTEEEAIALANDNRYGLSASLWTRDVSAAHRVAACLEAGAVAVNCWSPLDARLPWGGVKDSGIGTDLSRKALDAYLEEKLVSIAL
ncbi:aldehyde dehydrogenase family protein [Hydrogenophaga sp. 5NK40-0174]|uniref:aldehyde dehydrogenase family protein n=1 Tax=Hydrogenophaga sp. 5NK40-0174 TaxID=3127649 RepID=UPI00310AE1FA